MPLHYKATVEEVVFYLTGFSGFPCWQRKWWF